MDDMKHESVQTDLFGYPKPIDKERTVPLPKPPPKPEFSKPEVEDTPVDNNHLSEDLRRKTSEWITDHPKAAQLFLRFGRELAARGKHFGIGLLAERIRWECTIEGWVSEEYKICNSYRAYIARWMINEDPSLEKYMRFREVSW